MATPHFTREKGLVTLVTALGVQEFHLLPLCKLRQPLAVQEFRKNDAAPAGGFTFDLYYIISCTSCDISSHVMSTSLM